MPPPRMVLSALVLDAPDAQQLAAFYERLLGWPREEDEPGWVTLRSPHGGPGLSFHSEPAYRRRLPDMGCLAPAA
jgi:catechol-2,3-dioxygenase